MKKFKFKLKHDKGILTLNVTSNSKLNAIKYVLRMNNNLTEILTINQI
jgi:hypothetical protein